MLRSQVITLNIIYDDHGGVRHPEYWAWERLLANSPNFVGGPRLSVEVMASGECKRIKRIKEER